MATSNKQESVTTGPATPWLGAGALLAGVGTVLLGPLLPHVSTQWHLADSDAGLLLFSKFIGAFLGGATVLRRLRFSILAGTLLSCVGFALFGVSTGLLTGCASLFISGLGLGQLIASTNILAGLRYRQHTGSALASLNFFWSFGAVGAGVLVGALLPNLGFATLLTIIGAAFLVTALGGFVQRRRDPIEVASGAQQSALPWPALLRFGALLFLYGGLETCLSGWLTTYTQRYAGGSLLGGQSGTVLLWVGITAGRALSSAVLRLARESIVQRIALAVSMMLIAALAAAKQVELFSLICLLLGVSLAPFFPATFAMYMRRKPTSREAGIVLAVSGLGAAAFPWLMGVLSTHTGSLRLAMIVPGVLAFLLLAVSAASFKDAEPARPAGLHTGEYSEKLGV